MWDMPVSDSIAARPATRSSREEDPGPIEPRPDLPATNAALVRCAAGDQAGCRDFLALLSRFRKGLVRKLHYGREVPEKDAEDAVADVFLRIYEQALAGALGSPPRKWWKKLYWRVRSQVFKNRNRAKRATPTASCLEERGRLVEALAVSTARAEEDGVVRHDFQAILEKACERLTPRERAVLLARVQGLSYKEIAKIVGTTPSAARVHYSKARSKLAEDEDKKDAA